MTKIKTDAFFPDTRPPQSEGAERKIENKRISFWLEKLFKQGERVRRDPLGSKTDQALTESGINEHTKNVATKIEDDAEIVNDLVKKSNRSIISITSMFPWDIFRNTIDVEESRVIFKFNQYLSSQSHSVDIKDISNVFIESSMFFATIQVVSRTFVQNDIKIGKLNKTKAIKVQSIIEGLRTFAENDINTSNYGIEELISKIGELHTNQVA